MRRLLILLLSLGLGACASRPVTPALAAYDPGYGYRAVNWQAQRGEPSFGLVVAMSGGGTRAAALAYGVLEELRRTPVPGDPQGGRMIDQVKVVTGVSGGSFTALAYALHGERLFDEYESRFLKRDVQHALLARVANPIRWPTLVGGSFTRTELAADYYDQVLFGGATFGDLLKNQAAPFVAVSATEITSGARLTFIQNTFDALCVDLSGVRLSRAAAASSAVPVIFAPVAFDNYAGSCGFDVDRKVEAIAGSDAQRAPNDRAHRRRRELAALTDSATHRYLHVVDGGVADNLALRSVIEGLELALVSRRFREVTGFDRLRRFAVIVVNSLSEPRVDWGQRESPPSVVAQAVKASSISIDRYSFEQSALLKDLVTLHQAMAQDAGGGNAIDFYPIEVSFDAIADDRERRYFMDLPTTLSLSDEQVDKTREVAGRLLRTSPGFRRLLRDMGESHGE